MDEDRSGLTKVTISIDDEIYRKLREEAAENRISIEELIVSRLVSYNELAERASGIEKKAIKLLNDITKLVGKGRVRAND